MTNPESVSVSLMQHQLMEAYRYMSHALQLAERGLYTTDPNPRVGCVLVKDGAVVGEGWHVRAGEPHAEINALRAAAERARGATAYVTLEPCCHHGRTPPCTDALIAAGVTEVVAAMVDPNPRVAGQGLAQLAAAGIAVRQDLLSTQAEALNPGFVMRMRQGRPFVRAKLAMSLDGRTAMASGESQWITGDAARADVQHWRARSAAILTGINTVLADDPSLNVRRADVSGAAPRPPLRVILDTRLALPPSARLLGLPGRTVVCTAVDDATKYQPLQQAGATVIHLPSADDGSLDLSAVMALLAREQINEVLLEAGATLNGAMLQAGLIDELVIYMAPHLMGDAARGLFHLPGLQAMCDRIDLDIIDIRAVGKDWRIQCKVSGDMESQH